MLWSLRRVPFALLAVALPLASSEEPCLVGRGMRAIAPLSPAAAKQLGKAPSTLLLVGEAQGSRQVTRARVISAEIPLAPALRGDARGPVVVLAALPEESLRRTARIARESGGRGAVVAGGRDVFAQGQEAGELPGAHG